MAADRKTCFPLCGMFGRFEVLDLHHGVVSDIQHWVNLQHFKLVTAR